MKRKGKLSLVRRHHRAFLMWIVTSMDFRSKPVVDYLEQDLDRLKVRVWAFSCQLRIAKDLPEEDAEGIDFCLISEENILILQKFRCHVRDRPRRLLLLIVIVIERVFLGSGAKLALKSGHVCIIVCVG